MKGTTADKVNLRKSNSISSSTRVILELNQNRYADMDLDYVDDNKNTYYGTTAEKQSYYSDRFPVSSVTKPIRPQKTGACFARNVPASFARTLPDYKYHGIKSFNKIYDSNTYSYLSQYTYQPKTRIYYPGPAVNYQVYSQFSNQSSGWDAFLVPIKYKRSFWTNKIVIGFETTLGTPGSVTISLDVSSSSTEDWRAISGTFTVNSDGQIILYRTSGSYNEAGTWSDQKPSYDVEDGYWDSSWGYINTAVRVRGVKINCPSPNGPVSLIEVSPKLTTDITDKLMTWSWSANLSESDSLYPIGSVSSNTGTIDIDNSQKFFSASKISTTQASLAELAKPETQALGYVSIEGAGENIAQFHGFISSWSEDSESKISLPIRDLAGLMQDVDAPDIIIKNSTPSQAIWRILEMSGVGPVKIKEYKDPVETPRFLDGSDVSDTAYYQEETFPVFFTRSTESLWEYIKGICSETGTAVYVDEDGIVNIATRNYLFNSRRPESISGNADWKFLGQDTTEDGSTSFADIESLSYTQDEPYNSVKLNYKPVKPRSTQNDPEGNWKNNFLGVRKNVPRNVFEEKSAIVLGIGALSRKISSVIKVNTITLDANHSTNGKKIVTTSSVHGFAVKDLIKIYGTDTYKLDKHVTVTAVTSNTFTYVDKGNSTTFDKATAGKVVTVYDADIYVNNSIFTYGSWGAFSGYLLVDQEIIKYDGARFQSIDSVTNQKKYTTVKTQDEFLQLSDSSKGAIEFRGRFTGIERGQFSTTKTFHEVGIDFSKWQRNTGVSPTSFTQYNYQKEETGEIDNAMKIHRANSVAGTRNTSIRRVFDKAYNHYFTRLKVRYSSTNDSRGGVVVWPKFDENYKVTDGIFFEIRSMPNKTTVPATASKPASTKDVDYRSARWKQKNNKQHEIEIFQMKSGRKVQSSSVKAYADTRDGQAENIRISRTRNPDARTSITQPGVALATWSLFMDNKAGDAYAVASITVDLSDFSSSNKKSVALYTVGKTTMYSYHIGGAKDTLGADEDKFSIGLTNILKNVLSNRSGVTAKVPYEIDNFDNSVRRVYYNNVVFSDTDGQGPLHDVENFWAYDEQEMGVVVAKKAENVKEGKKGFGFNSYDIYSPSDGEVAYAMSRVTPWSAEIFAANTADRPLALSRNYPTISGPVVEISASTPFSEKKNESSISRLGIKLFQKDLKWISEKDDADRLAKDILSLAKTGGIKYVNISSFNNHLIQLADCVKISYEQKDFNSDESYIVRQIDSSWNNGLRQEIQLVTQDAR